MPRKKVSRETPAVIGRPLSLTPDLSARIAGLLSRGLTQADVIAALRIPKATYYAWLQRAKDIRHLLPDDVLGPDDLQHLTLDELTLLDFLDAVTGARVEAKRLALSAVRAGFATDWRAAAWFLERSYPEEFGRRDRLTVGAEETVEVRIVWPEEKRVDDDAIETRLADD